MRGAIALRATKANKRAQGSFGYLIQAAPGDVPRITVACVLRANKRRVPFSSVDYEECMGAKKHLVLGSLSYIGPPQGKKSAAIG